jgi:Flp pilus assembly protein protease CpaA
MQVPKWLTLPALALGLAFNVLRGGLVGATVAEGWLLQVEGPGSGALDGALFAGAGFLTAFGLFLVMWLLGVCGGGDVKLFAAVGAWLGPALTLRLFFFTIVVVAVVLFAKAVVAAFSGGLMRQRPAKNRRDSAAVAKPKKRLLAFSPALTVATALVLLWKLGGELQVMPVITAPPGSTAHVR